MPFDNWTKCLQQPPNCDATACRLSPVSVLVHMDTWELSSRSPQGLIQDLKKEGAQGVRGLATKIFLANLGDFSKYLAQKELGVRPPSGSAPAPGHSSLTLINNRNSNVSTRVFHNKRNDDRNTSTSVWVHQSFCKHAAITSRKALKLPYRGRICTT